MRRITKIPGACRVISALTVVCFLGTSSAFGVPFQRGSSSASAPAASKEPAPKSFDIQEVLNLSIPESYGTIKERFEGKSPHAVIAVQDSHVNYEAQMNFVRILEFLQKTTLKNHLGFIGVEGADGPVDVTRFRVLPDKDALKWVSDFMVKQGYLTGSEFFDINAKDAIELWGIESSDLYVENLRCFIRSQKESGPSKEIAKEIRGLLDLLRQSVYPGDLRDLSFKTDAYDNEKLPFSDYCAYVASLCKTKGVNIERYPTFSRVIQAIELEKNVDFKKLDSERSAFINTLQRKMVKEDMTKLVTQSLYYRLGRITSGKFYAYLKTEAQKYKVDLKAFPNLSRYIDITRIYDEIDIHHVFFELEQVVGDVKAVLFDNPDQKILDRLYKNISSIEKMLNLKMSRDDLAYYKEHRDELQGAVMVRDLTGLLARNPQGVEVNPDWAKITDPMEAMEGFYDAALQRDDKLLANALLKMTATKAKIAVVITGGFHTKGMTDKLKAKNISYVVITPRLTQGPDDALYISIMLNERTPFERFFSRVGNRLAPWLVSAIRQVEGDFAGKLINSGRNNSEFATAFYSLYTGLCVEKYSDSVDEINAALKAACADPVAGVPGLSVTVEKKASGQIELTITQGPEQKTVRIIAGENLAGVAGMESAKVQTLMVDNGSFQVALLEVVTPITPAVVVAQKGPTERALLTTAKRATEELDEGDIKELNGIVDTITARVPTPEEFNEANKIWKKFFVKTPDAVAIRAQVLAILGAGNENKMGFDVLRQIVMEIRTAYQEGRSVKPIVVTRADGTATTYVVKLATGALHSKTNGYTKPGAPGEVVIALSKDFLRRLPHEVCEKTWADDVLAKAAPGQDRDVLARSIHTLMAVVLDDFVEGKPLDGTLSAQHEADITAATPEKLVAMIEGTRAALDDIRAKKETAHWSDETTAIVMRRAILIMLKAYDRFSKISSPEATNRHARQVALVLSAISPVERLSLERVPAFTRLVNAVAYPLYRASQKQQILEKALKYFSPANADHIRDLMQRINLSDPSVRDFTQGTDACALLIAKEAQIVAAGLERGASLETALESAAERAQKKMAAIQSKKLASNMSELDGHWFYMEGAITLGERRNLTGVDEALDKLRKQGRINRSIETINFPLTVIGQEMPIRAGNQLFYVALGEGNDIVLKDASGREVSRGVEIIVGRTRDERMPRKVIIENDKTLSGQHFALKRLEGGNVRLADLGSTNRTYVPADAVNAFHAAMRIQVARDLARGPAAGEVQDHVVGVAFRPSYAAAPGKGDAERYRAEFNAAKDGSKDTQFKTFDALQKYLRDKKINEIDSDSDIKAPIQQAFEKGITLCVDTRASTQVGYVVDGTGRPATCLIDPDPDRDPKGEKTLVLRLSALTSLGEGANEVRNALLHDITEIDLYAQFRGAGLTDPQARRLAHLLALKSEEQVSVTVGLTKIYVPRRFRAMFLRAGPEYLGNLIKGTDPSKEELRGTINEILTQLKQPSTSTPLPSSTGLLARTSAAEKKKNIDNIIKSCTSGDPGAPPIAKDLESLERVGHALSMGTETLAKEFRLYAKALEDFDSYYKFRRQAMEEMKGIHKSAVDTLSGLGPAYLFNVDLDLPPDPQRDAYIKAWSYLLIRQKQLAEDVRDPASIKELTKLKAAMEVLTKRWQRPVTMQEALNIVAGNLGDVPPAPGVRVTSSLEGVETLQTCVDEQLAKDRKAVRARDLGDLAAAREAARPPAEDTGLLGLLRRWGAITAKHWTTDEEEQAATQIAQIKHKKKGSETWSEPANKDAIAIRNALGNIGSTGQQGLAQQLRILGFIEDEITGFSIELQAALEGVLRAMATGNGSVTEVVKINGRERTIKIVYVENIVSGAATELSSDGNTYTIYLGRGNEDKVVHEILELFIRENKRVVTAAKINSELALHAAHSLTVLLEQYVYTGKNVSGIVPPEAAADIDKLSAEEKEHVAANTAAQIRTIADKVACGALPMAAAILLIRQTLRVRQVALGEAAEVPQPAEMEGVVRELVADAERKDIRAVDTGVDKIVGILTAGLEAKPVVVVKAPVAPPTPSAWRQLWATRGKPMLTTADRWLKGQFVKEIELRPTPVVMALLVVGVILGIATAGWSFTLLPITPETAPLAIGLATAGSSLLAVSAVATVGVIRAHHRALMQAAAVPPATFDKDAALATIDHLLEAIKTGSIAVTGVENPAEVLTRLRTFLLTEGKPEYLKRLAAGKRLALLEKNLDRPTEIGRIIRQIQTSLGPTEAEKQRTLRALSAEAEKKELEPEVPIVAQLPVAALPVKPLRQASLGNILTVANDLVQGANAKENVMDKIGDLNTAYAELSSIQSDVLLLSETDANRLLYLSIVAGINAEYKSLIEAHRNDTVRQVIRKLQEFNDGTMALKPDRNNSPEAFVIFRRALMEQMAAMAVKVVSDVLAAGSGKEAQTTYVDAATTASLMVHLAREFPLFLTCTAQRGIRLGEEAIGNADLAEVNTFRKRVEEIRDAIGNKSPSGGVLEEFLRRINMRSVAISLPEQIRMVLSALLVKNPGLFNGMLSAEAWEAPDPKSLQRLIDAAPGLTLDKLTKLHSELPVEINALDLATVLKQRVNTHITNLYSQKASSDASNRLADTLRSCGLPESLEEIDQIAVALGVTVAEGQNKGREVARKIFEKIFAAEQPSAPVIDVRSLMERMEIDGEGNIVEGTVKVKEVIPADVKKLLEEGRLVISHEIADTDENKAILGKILKEARRGRPPVKGTDAFHLVKITGSDATARGEFLEDVLKKAQARVPGLYPRRLIVVTTPENFAEIYQYAGLNGDYVVAILHENKLYMTGQMVKDLYAILDEDAFKGLEIKVGVLTLHPIPPTGVEGILEKVRSAKSTEVKA